MCDFDYKLGDKNEDGGVLGYVPIKEISPMYLNPTRWCNPDKLMKMKFAIENGVMLPPIELIRKDLRITIYKGHHRWFAHFLAGKDLILAWKYY